MKDGAGRLKLKLRSALLGRLSEAIIRRILAHLKSAILPPSRAQLERGVPTPPHSPVGSDDGNVVAEFKFDDSLDESTEGESEETADDESDSSDEEHYGRRHLELGRN